MLFNSLEYLLFFCAALIAGWVTIRLPRLRLGLLLIASYVFYTLNNHWLILLIAASTLIDFVAGQRIEDEPAPDKRKRWLWASMLSNLGILGYFKYANFFAGSIAAALAGMGIEMDWVDLNILLPVGISFYTFQSMSYTIDVYRGRLEAERSLLHFAFYISYFPQLIAGPIVRATDFLPQTRLTPSLDVRALDSALYRIFKGLFKKIVLADLLAIYANQAYNAPAEADSLTVWIGVYAFSLQIYFDFSGYTDIAIGCARLMGFKLPENFNAPYIAASFSDFWRRWHITLSGWLRDYLYIPLGGSRTNAPLGVYRNLMITMTLCGLWHGAAWPFVVWGAMHGVILCAERLLGWNKQRHASWIRAFVMFNLFSLSWLPFRVQNVADLSTMVERMFAFEPPAMMTYGMIAAVLIVGGAWLAQLISLRFDYNRSVLGLPMAVKGFAYGILWAAIIVFNSAGAQPFIYFQF